MADPSTARPLLPSSIEEAHAKIKPYIHFTPLITSKTIDRISSHPDPRSFLAQTPPGSPPVTNGHSTQQQHPTPKFNLYFKCENQQKIGAFKARGAHHALIRLISVHGLDHIRKCGVITHSSGNHAQALALAASNFDVPSHIVMPSISTPSKIAGTKMYTSNVYFSGSTSTEREAKVAEIQEKTGAILIPPYDHPDIILGQGTAAFEMESQFRELKKTEQQQQQQQQQRQQRNASLSNPSNDTQAEVEAESEPRFDAVLTPLGGGGLLGGTATWFSHTLDGKKRTLVFGTEPSFSGANDAELGLAATPPERIPHVKSLTIADGLRTPVGVLNWSIVSDKAKVAGVYSVTEEQIKDALRLMMERVKVFVEPSAVVPVAVVLFCEEFRNMVARKQAEERTGRAWDVGVVLSGGNTTVEAVAKMFSTGSAGDERQIGQVGMDGEKKAEDVAG